MNIAIGKNEILDSSASRSTIKKVAVIGSGVMGSQIAAHVTNAGIPVLLLDIVAKEGERSALAAGALERMKKMDPSPFMHATNADLMTVGNLEDDLNKLAEVDWIIEAIVENPKIKSELYHRLDAVRKPGSIVSSNTSTIPLGVLVRGQSDQFTSDFLITHFFNPPRAMRLLELVAGPKTDLRVASVVRDFCDRKLGKGVVDCKDTAGFVANRLGIFFLQAAVNAAFEHGLTVEEADAVFGKAAGMPKTGVFGLIDLIGLDLMPLIASSFMATLPPDDVYRQVNIDHPLLNKMIADGYTGRKGKGGFYRFRKTDAGKVKESINLVTGEYAESPKVKPQAIEKAGTSLRALCESPDKIGKFAWKAISETLAYAASLLPQIADDIVAVDSGMRWGFNWKYGPFELIDQLGVDWFIDKLRSEGRFVPSLLLFAAGRTFYRVSRGTKEYLSVQGIYTPIVRPDGVLLLEDVRRRSEPVLKNESSCLWDIGDGVLCFEFYTKMNTFDMGTFSLLRETTHLINNNRDKYKGLVIYNEGPHFSCGANINFFIMLMESKQWDLYDQLLQVGQDVFRDLAHANFPVVGAPSGFAIGGGCEILLHCTAIQAYAEANIGLVETGIGVVPAWGGTMRMVRRAFERDTSPSTPSKQMISVFDTIGNARISKTAFEARDYGYLRPTDGVTMNRDRLLYDAKCKLLAIAENFTPQRPAAFDFKSHETRIFLKASTAGDLAAGKITKHDARVRNSLATVLTDDEGMSFGPMTEQRLRDLERREFVELCKTKETYDRVVYTLKTGKHLKN